MTAHATTHAWDITVNGAYPPPAERLALLVLADCTGAGDDPWAFEVSIRYLIDRLGVTLPALFATLTAMTARGLISDEWARTLPWPQQDGEDGASYTSRVLPLRLSGHLTDAAAVSA